MSDDDFDEAHLVSLAHEYRCACHDMPRLWSVVMETAPGTTEREDAVREHTKGRHRCELARRALIDFVRGGTMETGA